MPGNKLLFILSLSALLLGGCANTDSPVPIYGSIKTRQCTACSRDSIPLHVDPTTIPKRGALFLYQWMFSARSRLLVLDIDQRTLQDLKLMSRKGTDGSIESTIISSREIILGDEKFARLEDLADRIWHPGPAEKSNRPLEMPDTHSFWDLYLFDGDAVYKNGSLFPIPDPTIADFENALSDSINK